MADTYVLVHGACHTGDELEPVAQLIREKGHSVYCPTLAGNRPEDDRSRTGLKEAAQSLVDFIKEKDLKDFILVGHSYGGMVISQASEWMGSRIKRLVYVNAFVPEPGQCQNDLMPAGYVDLFAALAKQNNGAVEFPFPIFREAFINDADLELATEVYGKLNPHPYKTFTDPVELSQPLVASPLAKSYVNCTMDVSLPASLPWHPRLSERLGLFRYVECPGSHEVWFTNPAAIANAVILAGRD